MLTPEPETLTRKWFAHITSADETSVEVQAVFNRALKLEGINDTKGDLPVLARHPLRPARHPHLEAIEDIDVLRAEHNGRSDIKSDTRQSIDTLASALGQLET